MGYADVIQQRLQILPQEKLAAVYDFVEFIAARNPVAETLDEDQRKARVLSVLQDARACWPRMGSGMINKWVVSVETIQSEQSVTTAKATFDAMLARSSS